MQRAHRRTMERRLNAGMARVEVSRPPWPGACNGRRVMPTSPPLRLALALLALAALVAFLLASWLRFLVPVRQPVHVRDARWLGRPAGR